MNNMQNFIEDKLIILTKGTLDEFLKYNNFHELIGLYSFYYYTAKWQATNTIKATTEYTAKGTGLGVNRVRKVKKQLCDMGLITDIQTKDENARITGHYVRINYIFTKTNEDNIKSNISIKNSTLTETNSTLTEIHRVEINDTNTLSNNNINTLSSNNINPNIIKNNISLNSPVVTEQTENLNNLNKTQNKQNLVESENISYNSLFNKKRLPPEKRQIANVYVEGLKKNIYRGIPEENLRTALINWLDVLFDKGKGMTSVQLDLAIKQLRKLSGDNEQLAIQIVENATISAYTNFEWCVPKKQIVSNSVKDLNQRCFLHNDKSPVDMQFLKDREEKERAETLKNVDVSSFKRDETGQVIF